MGWSLGFDHRWNRDVGYGVPAYCDFPGCGKKIHRGLSYVCGTEPMGGDYGCGLYFCTDHLRDRQPRGETRSYQFCPRCIAYRKPYRATPDHPEWVDWKLTDDSWEEWRKQNPDAVAHLIQQAAPRANHDLSQRHAQEGRLNRSLHRARKVSQP